MQSSYKFLRVQLKDESDSRLGNRHEFKFLRVQLKGRWVMKNWQKKSGLNSSEYN